LFLTLGDYATESVSIFLSDSKKTSIFQTLSHLTFCFSLAMKAKSSSVTDVINIQLHRSFMNIWVGCDAWVAVHCSSRNFTNAVCYSFVR